MDLCVQSTLIQFTKERETVGTGSTVKLKKNVHIKIGPKLINPLCVVLQKLIQLWKQTRDSVQI